VPKSRKRRTAKAKKAAKQIQRRLTTPMPAARPKHPGYTQTCPPDRLIDEFGEEGAEWLQGEYGGPLTVADFRLEQCIRRDEFILDDPIDGPVPSTAEQISRLLEMTFQVAVAMARQQGPLPEHLAREAAEVEADGPNDRDRWDFPE
jgi:hypothetical protein